ncbi:Uncharacterized protein PBTT_05241 [Plasmodiophora brassicae]|uniref:Uncharacterized protein n=1 Tax=Plasmodiophora brassicae TaxID=37360 RepID=A0A0G4IQM6_PLABS|nr:hypothetical protein PBRA_000978 [Plasmodiophora brassicae]SPQ97929.1 unnamed protein product [Plasmodiophora brassicae]
MTGTPSPAGTIACSSRDLPPSASDRPSKSLLRLQKSIGAARAPSKRNKGAAPGPRRIERRGENFYQFVKRVNAETAERVQKIAAVSARRPSASTARFRERRKERQREKRLVDGLDRRDDVSKTAPSVGIQAPVEAPPKLGVTPKRRQPPAPVPVPISDQLERRRRDLLRERVQAAYKNAKQARRSASSAGCSSASLDRFL